MERTPETPPLEVKKRIAGELGYPVLAITQAGLRVNSIDSGEGQVSQDYSKYQILDPGEFVRADVVTGKLDAREAAARLPDDVADPNPLAEADSDVDAEDDTADDLEFEPEEAET